MSRTTHFDPASDPKLSRRPAPVKLVCSSTAHGMNKRSRSTHGSAAVSASSRPVRAAVRCGTNYRGEETYSHRSQGALYVPSY